MKRRVYALGAGLLLLGLMPGLTSASTFTPDQSNTLFDHYVQNSYIDAQTFKAGMYGPLQSVDLYLMPSPSGTVGMTIQGTTGSAGNEVPNGTVLSSRTLGVSGTGGWTRFWLTNPILTPGHVYAIVFIPTDNVQVWGTKISEYTHGRALVFSAGSWVDQQGLLGTSAPSDFAFQTNMGPASPTPTPTHAPTHRPTTRPTPTRAPTAAPAATPTAAAATPAPTTVVGGATAAPSSAATDPGAGAVGPGSGSGGSSGSGDSTMPMVIGAIVALALLGGLLFLLLRRRGQPAT